MALKEKQFTQLEESLSKTTKERDELQSRHQTEMTDLKQQLDGELSKAQEEILILQKQLRERDMELQLESQENDKLDEMKEMVKVSEKLIEDKTNELIKAQATTEQYKVQISDMQE